VVNIIRFDDLITRDDTRRLAKDWIEDHIPAGQKIAIDWPIHVPPLSSLDKLEPQSKAVYDTTPIFGTGLSDHPVDWYRQQGFNYLIATSFIYDIPLINKVDDAQRRDYYDSLDKQFHLVYQIKPGNGGSEPAFIFDEIYGPFITLWDREKPGPTIKVYEIRR
jgi:hypothetical protein